MPRTDAHFKYLIGAGLQRNISLRKFLFVTQACMSREVERTELTRNLFSILRRELQDRRVIEKEFRKRLNRELREEFLSIRYLMAEHGTTYISEQ